MKILKFLSAFLSVIFGLAFGALGVCAAAAAIFVSAQIPNAQPVLLQTPPSAVSQAAAVMDAACDADYAALETLFYGSPSLGFTTEIEGPISTMIWEAFTGSLSYEFNGECYATADGLEQAATVRYMDIESATLKLTERAQSLLQARVDAAEDVSEIYDANNEYREDLVNAVLLEAATQALEQDIQYRQVEITLRLVYTEGQWRVLPNTALLEAVSGGILK